MGTNTLIEKLDGDIIEATDINQFEEALQQDLVPRNTSGVATAVGGNLGNATYPWLEAFIGASAAGVSVAESGNKMILKVGGSTVATIGANGLEIGSYADNSVTKEKLEATAYNKSATSSGLASVSAASFTNFANMTATITTSGRPVLIAVIPDVTNNNSGIYGAGSGVSSFRIARATTTSISSYQQGTAGTYSFLALDSPSAGTWTYSFQVQNTITAAVLCYYMHIIAIELL